MTTTATDTKPAATKTWTRRIIWSCKCGLVQRHEYAAVSTYRFTDRVYGTHKYSEPRVTREVDGVRRDVSFDYKCPCGRDRKGAQVKGVRTDHVCDARCQGATGSNCECACGGENHGKAHG